MGLADLELGCGAMLRLLIGRGNGRNGCTGRQEWGPTWIGGADGIVLSPGRCGCRGGRELFRRLVVLVLLV